MTENIPDPDEDHARAKYIKAMSTSPAGSWSHQYEGMPHLIGSRCVICGKWPAATDHMSFPGGIGPLGPNPMPLPDPNALNILGKPGVFVEILGPNHIKYEFVNLATDEQIRIVRDVLPDLLNKFFAKNVDYQDFDPTADLGAKAHFLGIWRKCVKLKRGLWEGKPLAGEDVSEVLDDLIGHALLAKLGLARTGRAKVE